MRLNLTKLHYILKVVTFDYLGSLNIILQSIEKFPNVFTHIRKHIKPQYFPMLSSNNSGITWVIPIPT